MKTSKMIISIKKTSNKKIFNRVKRKKSQRGQVLIEAVLLLTLVVGLWSAFSNYAKQQKWFENIITGPWDTMSGMIESGVWKPSKKAQAEHPNNFNRVVSYREQQN